MKSKILSMVGIGAIAMAVACNSSKDEAAKTDTLSTADNTRTVAAATIQTAADGKKYVVRKRTVATTGDNSTSATSEYDTVWLYTAPDSRYYTLRNTDTIYFDTEAWNNWWNDVKTDDELKAKSDDLKVKVDEDGSWKVKNKKTGEKTKMNDDGEIKKKKD